MNRFNIRVYGILQNKKREYLLSTERRNGYTFTKFPGGGLEFGEGMLDCLKREFKEELNIDVEVGELFYLTDYFQVSAFNKEHQLISVYYHVHFTDCIGIQCSELEDGTHDQETFFWKAEIHPDMLTFPIDKIVAEKLQKS